MPSQSPTHAAMLEAERHFLETLMANRPQMIRANADVSDIRDRLDNIGAIHKAWTAYARAIIADLNDTISLTEAVGILDFSNQMADAFADLRGNAQRAANDMANNDRAQADRLLFEGV